MHKASGKWYSVKEFITKYQSRCPVLIRVTQGYLGNNEWETIATGQIIRVHSVKIIPRVDGQILTQNGSKTDAHVSLSVSGEVITTKGRKKTIADLVRQGKLPCKVQLTDKYSAFGQSSSLPLDKPLPVLLEDKTELKCLLGNPVSGVELFERIIVIPEALEDMRIEVISGVEGLDQVHWEQLQAHLSDVVNQYIEFENCQAIEDVMCVLSNNETKHRENKYEYLQFHPIDKKVSQYDLFKPKQRPDMQDEPTYAIIPDQSYEYLSHQSNAWKQKLKLQETEVDVKQVTCDNKNNECNNENESRSFQSVLAISKEKENPPTIPKRNTSLKSKSAPPVPPKPVTAIKCDIHGEATQTTEVVETKRPPIVKVEPKLDELCIEDVGLVLKSLNLHNYVEVFADSMVDGPILKEFDDETFSEFGFTKIETIRLKKFIETGHVPK